MIPAPDPQLREDVATLTRRVEVLVEHMERLVHDKVETEVASQAVPREEFTDRIRSSGRRAAAGMIVLLALIALAVGINRYTLLQAQRDLNNQVVRCFLRPGSNTPAQTRACADRFGSGYSEAQERSRAATADFADLREWARDRGWKPPSEQP
jgi:uncharacterized protein HemX